MKQQSYRCAVALLCQRRNTDHEVRIRRLAGSGGLTRRDEGYERVAASWRGQNPLAVTKDMQIVRTRVEGDLPQE